jgi:hypothetical protein
VEVDDNIKMVLREIGCEGANMIQLSQEQVSVTASFSTVMSLRVLQAVEKFVPVE